MERFFRTVRHLRSNRDAAVAVEFAMILPLMLLFYLGTYEVSQAIIAKRKVENAAETVGGIVARSQAMDATRIANVLMISDAIVGSLDPTALQITVTSVKVDVDGKATVDWSRKGSSVGVASGSAYTMPADLKAFKDAYFVFSTATYDYKPLFGYGGIIEPMRFERTFSFRPRKGSEIPWS